MQKRTVVVIGVWSVCVTVVGLPSAFSQSSGVSESGQQNVLTSPLPGQAGHSSSVEFFPALTTTDRSSTQPLERPPFVPFQSLLPAPDFVDSHNGMNLASSTNPASFVSLKQSPSDFVRQLSDQFHQGQPGWNPLADHYQKFWGGRISRISSFSRAPSAVSDSDFGEIAVILNPAVERSLQYFQTVIPDRFQEWLTRFSQYQPLVQQIFEEFGLPTDLMYLSLIESGFNPRAYSRARAAGPWQFIRATGRLYNLRVDWYVDERRDPIKSTVAAAQHLRDLYDRFGSWPLAMAAYNAGTGKITRAIRRSGTRDFWKIRRTRYIRRETKDYVPRFMAATIIATNPSLFGFTSHSFHKVHQYEEVRLLNMVHLRSVAKETGISFEELRRLNPELRRSVVPAEKGGYFLKVPAGMGQQVEKVKDRLQRWTQLLPQSLKWYRVRRGDSLSVIASRFGMSVRKLKSLNNLSGHMIRVGDRLQVGEGTTPSPGGWYRVQSGDSLSVIANRFGISLATLKRLNNLSGHMIRVGDRLQVSSPLSPSADTQNLQWYRVRRGDSLWSIAKRFSMTVHDLITLNNLPGTVIHAGRRLLVSP